MASTTEAPEGATQSEELGVRLTYIAQYVRDLSFENPGAPQMLQEFTKSKPSIEVGVNVNARKVADDTFECTLMISATAKSGDKTAFVVELDFGALWGIADATEAQMEQVLLIECPRLMFPFARRILADATRDGGFPPLALDPIDFVQLYDRAKAQGKDMSEQVQLN